MCNWITLDKETLDQEWQERNNRQFLRYLNESDKTLAQQLWDIAYTSESMRMDWQYECLVTRGETQLAIARLN